MGNSSTDTCCLTLPLKLEKWQEDRLAKRFELARQIYNTLVRAELKKLERVKHSAPYREIQGQIQALDWELPENIIFFHIPPYTPEMNPIEQIWKEIRKRRFRNEVFATLEKVVDRLCDTICSLSNNAVSSITGRDWITKVFS